MECTITHLIKDGDRVTGAFGYWRESGKFVLFRANAINLATGGVGKALQIHFKFLGVYGRRPLDGV